MTSWLPQIVKKPALESGAITLLRVANIELLAGLRLLIRRFIKRAPVDEPRNVLLANFKLETLGHHEKALAELKDQTRHPTSARVRAYARWRLALWHFRGGPSDPLFVRIPGWARQSLRAALPRELRAQLYLLLILSTASNNSRYQHLPIKARRLHQFARYGCWLYPKRRADFLLAFMASEDDESERLKRLQDVYNYFDLPIPLIDRSKDVNKSLLDRIVVDTSSVAHAELNSDCLSHESAEIYHGQKILVSVIIATYNSEQTIQTAISSLQCQTWTNIEIIVADDASTDNTVALVTELAKSDGRIRLIRQVSNQGAYVARNIAIQQSKGRLITLHDADDWSHPLKLETQILPLLKSSKIQATTSRRIRVSDDLQIVKLSSRGWILGLNTSSLLIRREILIDRLKGWHSVRFGADTELIKRLQALCGPKSLCKIASGPLSIQRLTQSSASAQSRTGYPGYDFGVRHIYTVMSAHYYRRTLTNTSTSTQALGPPDGLYPQCMLPNRVSNKYYSVIIASEFRMKGGSTLSSVEELKIHLRYGVSTAVIPLYRYDLNPYLSELDVLYDHIDPSCLPVITSGDTAECDLLVLRYPPSLAFFQSALPKIKAKNVVVVVNQPPYSDYSSTLALRYSIPAVAANIKRWLGRDPLWAPIGPLVRQALDKFHADELLDINFSPNDWHNVIDLSSWKLRDITRHLSTLTNRPLRIGRHSRDDLRKWPSNPADLLSSYPTKPEFEIHVLGGVKSAKKILGGNLPGNWTEYPFGSMHPSSFLQKLDVFVYFTDSGWVESFGRVIIEAMAVGVPVILPPTYQDLFEDAAIYCLPHEVEATVASICADHHKYLNQVCKARRYVESRFSWQTHLNRLSDYNISISAESVNPLA
jgi:glycosyltransferase involved in cell wall biosynthesis